jgi:predicted NAD/FAD-binding protein
MRIAVVGSGVAGLVAASELHREHEVTVFERNRYLGGHARTHLVDDRPSGRRLALDTGFLVFNEPNYPLFCRLLERLGVASQPADMSFGVRCARCGVEYSSRGLRGLFARPRQALSPGFHRMAVDIVRFNRWARGRGRRLDSMSVADLRRARLFGDGLFRHYLVPMAAAIWSSPAADIGRLPLRFLVDFFDNHGLLQTTGHPPWRTIVGGSRRYVEALVRPFADRVRIASPVRVVQRRPGEVTVRTDAGGAESFDHVVIATHTDQALALLDDADETERRALSALPYQRNAVVLHTDPRQLPRAAAARAAWNYRAADCRNDSSPITITYSLNRLQRLDTETAYCVTLNPPAGAGGIDPAAVIARLSYSHPVYSPEGLVGRRLLAAANGRRRTTYCGAWFGNGFHEDGVRAGLGAARTIREAQEPA